jgi:catalase
MADGTAVSSNDLDAKIDTITQLQLALMQGAGTQRRGQHPKQHGCVRASFEVLADIPDRFKVGLFAKPATFNAYVRFSNGKEFDDTKPDIHGMAIKLTGVPGLKVLESEATAPTHDFILADNPVFIIRDTDEYVRFVQNVAQTVPFGKKPLKFLAWVALHHPQDLPVLLRFFRGHVVDSPLAAEYWSQVPYAFGRGGRTICRYSAVPQPGNMIAPIAPADRNADYLQQAMINHLTSGQRSAKFDFMVQLRDDATPAVIDNPTVTWDVPSQRVAVITIAPKKFDSPEQMRFCENLSYTPWHALPEHCPIGQVNEIRKAVYLASSSLRHKTNQVVPTEPTGNEF